jgi:aminomethyltransferase
MKTIPLNEIHQKLGAKMLPYAGFLMPIEYSGIISEHLNVRENAGLFDVSHMGLLWVKGQNAYNLLQYITTNDVSKLLPGKAQYSCLPNGKGGIVDDIIVYRYSEEKYMIVVNAANIDKDWEWINKKNIFNAELQNASDEISILALQGPKSVQILQKLVDIDLTQIKPFTFITTKVAGEPDVIVSATGYTGSGGFEIICYNKSVLNLWNSISNAGKEFDLKPIGLAARDTLRLEKGYTLYGNDIDDTTSPIEANLDWIVKFTDYKNFIDKELLYKQKINGVTRKLIGLKMVDKGIPRHGYNVCSKESNIIGHVTSGTMSPSLKQGIAMAYLNINYCKPNTEVFINIRDKLLKAIVVNFPFV